MCLYKGDYLNKHNNSKLPYENIMIVDLATGTDQRGESNFSDKMVDKASSILATKLLDYMKNGGDMNNLTPSAVFGKNAGGDKR